MRKDKTRLLMQLGPASKHVASLRVIWARSTTQKRLMRLCCHADNKSQHNPKYQLNSNHHDIRIYKVYNPAVPYQERRRDGRHGKRSPPRVAGTSIITTTTTSTPYRTVSQLQSLIERVEAVDSWRSATARTLSVWRITRGIGRREVLSEADTVVYRIRAAVPGMRAHTHTSRTSSQPFVVEESIILRFWAL